MIWGSIVGEATAFALRLQDTGATEARDTGAEGATEARSHTGNRRSHQEPRRKKKNNTLLSVIRTLKMCLLRYNKSEPHLRNTQVRPKALAGVHRSKHSKSRDVFLFLQTQRYSESTVSEPTALRTSGAGLLDSSLSVSELKHVK